MLPHFTTIVELLSGVIIVTHSAMALRISSLTYAEYESLLDGSELLVIYDYIWPEQRRAEQQINGVTLPFLM